MHRVAAPDPARRRCFAPGRLMPTATMPQRSVEQWCSWFLHVDSDAHRPLHADRNRLALFTAFGMPEQQFMRADGDRIVADRSFAGALAVDPDLRPRRRID